MDDSTVDADLICAGLDDALGPEERLVMARRIVADPLFAQSVADQMMVAHVTAAHLWSQGQATTGSRVAWLLQQRRQSQRHVRTKRVQGRLAAASTLGRAWRWLALGSALTAAALLVLVVWPWDEEAVAAPLFAEVIQGGDGRQSLRAGDSISATGTACALRLVHDGGSLVTLDADSTVQIGNGPGLPVLKLNSGSLRCHAQPQDQANPLVFTAGLAHCTVVGTEFTLRRGASDAELVVTHGQVHVAITGNDQAAISVDAGHRVVVFDDGGVVRGAADLAVIDDLTGFMPRAWQSTANPATRCTQAYVRDEVSGRRVLSLDCQLQPDPMLDMWAQASVDLASEPVDGRHYAGLSVRICTPGTGQKMQVVICERSLTGDEAWSYAFIDDVAGWRSIDVEWSAFQRNREYQPRHPANDGFSASAIIGLNVGYKRAHAKGPVNVRFSLAEARLLPTPAAISR